MGSPELKCPLCCSEKFPSLSSLKNHLLGVLDKLSCPVCDRRFEKIADLAEHLGKNCTEQHPMEHLNGVQVKKEQEDFEEVLNKSILAKALLRRDVRDATSETEENADEDDLFYCSSCAINFTSVDEHLQKYHVGHEVLIQDGDEVVSKAILECNDDESQDADLEKLFEDENASDSDEDVKARTKNEFPQILNTVQQQECFDKDGRLYTRKVVKIEKFWEEAGEGARREPPVSERFIVVNGRATKMSDGDADEESPSVIELHQCKSCHSQFAKLEAYYKHHCSAETVVSKSRQYRCSKCAACFLNSKSLCAHMKVHKEEKESVAPHSGPYICEECNTDFPSYKSLRLHKRMHDPIKSREIEAPVSYGLTGGSVEEAQHKETMREMFVCEICNKTYDKQYEDAHMSFHKDEENFDCDICNRKFYTKTNLDMHMRVHSTGKKFACSYCKKAFLTFENLQEHVTNQCQKRRYECQYCGRRFARPHEKVKHERIHTGEKPHICEICGKAFRVSYCLTLHMRTHSGTRPYQCPYCNKRFKAHSVFNHHLLTHSDVRAYKCPYCPKAFKTGVQLAGHKNSHIKPFTCTECNRPFASLYAVRAHMETHKRENNLKFSCWMCGASYARAFALRDHIKDHHGEEQEELAANSLVSQDEVLIQLEEGEAVEEMDSIDAVESVETISAVDSMEVISIAAAE